MLNKFSGILLAIVLLSLAHRPTNAQASGVLAYVANFGDGRLALKITRSNGGDYDPAVYLWDGQTFTFVAETAYAYPFAWSADGALAFHTISPLQLHVWRAGEIVNLGEGHSPAWNADGRLAFVCRFWQVCVGDGQTPVQIADGTNPQWVP
jgi:hypothetical protein